MELNLKKWFSEVGMLDFYIPIYMQTDLKKLFSLHVMCVQCDNTQLNGGIFVE
jgi:hypothetical protein